jgi:hypothetical protein
MSLLCPDQISDLKAVGLVNITYGDGQGMLCGQALSPNDKHS